MKKTPQNILEVGRDPRGSSKRKILEEKFKILNSINSFSALEVDVALREAGVTFQRGKPPWVVCNELFALQVSGGHTHNPLEPQNPA